MKPPTLRTIILSALLFIGTFLALTLAAAEAPQITGISDTLKISWVQTLIIIAVPMIIAGLKLLWPRIPSVALPFLCPALGYAIDQVAQLAGLDLGNPAVSAALGALGNWLRETYDQSKKAVDARSLGNSGNVSGLLLASAISLGTILGATGCKTFNPQTGEREYNPVTTEQVKAAMQPLVTSALRRTLAANTDKAIEIGAYFRAVGNIFCEMEATKQFDPLWLEAEISKVVLPRIDNSLVPEIRDVALALYRIFYADRFRAELSPEKWPVHVASLLCASIDQALKDSGQPGVK